VRQDRRSRRDRYRLHRGGDRNANSALWRIALVRMHCHQPTKDYVARRTAEGRTKKEILRCLQRYIAREAYPLLIRPCVGPYGRGSTPLRNAA